MQLWLKSILVGSCLLAFGFILQYGGQEEMSSNLSFLLALIFIAAVLSWLNFLLCFFIFKRLLARSVELKRIKTILCGVAIASILLTCLFFEAFESDPPFNIVIPASYSVAVLLATVATRIQKTKADGG